MTTTSSGTPAEARRSAHDVPMGTGTFTLSTTTSAAPSTVIDFLAALDRHRDLHPFLVSATVVAEDSVASRQDWRVVERPRLGPLGYTIRFGARLVRTGPEALHSEVRPAPGCTLLADTTATRETDGRTRVSECCTVEAPWFLVGYMTRQARVAHARVFAGLAAALGDSP